MKSAYENIPGFWQELSRLNSTEDILKKLSCSTVNITKASFAVAALYDKINEEFFYFSCCDRLLPVCREEFHRIKKGQGLMGWCAGNKQTINLNPASTDPRFDKKTDGRLLQAASSAMLTPIQFREELIGVLEIIDRTGQKSFSRDDEIIVSCMADLCAILIKHERLYEEHINKEHFTDLGESMAGSAHGLKNLLNNMDGGSFIVEKGVQAHDIEKVNKGWDIMKRNSQRIRSMVLDMLLFSRPAKPQYQPTDLNKICRDIAELILPNARQQNTAITLETDKSIGMVCLDPKSIYRGILNLVSNAVHACNGKKSGHVEIATRLKNPEQIEIQIRDNGSGISKQNLKYIFDVFFTTKGSKGTGLGLPVTKKIIAEHNGTITVHSRAGRGSIFTITLPRVHERECRSG